MPALESDEEGANEGKWIKILNSKQTINETSQYSQHK